MNRGKQSSEDPPSGSRASLSSALGYLSTGLWLFAAVAGFVGFFVWYFLTLEQPHEGTAPAVYKSENILRRMDGAAPATGVLLQDLDTQAKPSFRATFLGHPSKHCAVRISLSQKSSAFVIIFVRMKEYFSLGLPVQKYDGMVACGATWDARDFSFVGVSPKVYREGEFLVPVQPGQDSGIDLGGFWDLYGDGQ